MKTQAATIITSTISTIGTYLFPFRIFFLAKLSNEFHVYIGIQMDSLSFSSELNFHYLVKLNCILYAYLAFFHIIKGCYRLPSAPIRLTCILYVIYAFTIILTFYLNMNYVCIQQHRSL